MLTTAQRKVLDQQAEQFVNRLIAKQFIGAARQIVLARDPDAEKDLLQKRAKDLAQERMFTKDRTKFTSPEDSAELVNKLSDDKDALQHNFDWLASYFKQLQPALNRFTKRLIKSGQYLNKSQLQQLMGIVNGVFKLVEVLDAAGAAASDIVEFIGTLEAQLKDVPSGDRKRAGLMNWLRK